MSSIKPPDGRGPAGGAPIGPQPSAEGAAKPGADFRDALAQAEGAAGAQATQANQAASATRGGDALSELARMVRGGALTPEQAVEQLVERAVGKHALDAGQRAELVRVLQSALEADFALRALREGLERGVG